MRPFDLLGPLPAAGSTTVLEASAGTGKTYTLAALVTRYLAEGAATLDQMLLITFSRAATQELRERVREQIRDAFAALAGEPVDTSSPLIEHLLAGDAEQRNTRRRLLSDALSDFDAATIATTHTFCHLVLKSLGVAGDTAAGVTLVESLADLIAEVVDDRYLAMFGAAGDEPALSYSDAVTLAADIVSDPYAQRWPLHPEPGSVAQLRSEFAESVLAELEVRKRRRLVLGYDDLLSRLAAALHRPDSDAGDRMRRRWPVVIVDEFQDTDPVQWQIIDRAFRGASTVILIGDPKQAIYGFRGADVHTYLAAVRTTDARFTLDTNWRSDAALVNAIQAVLRGSELGHPEIVVTDVRAKRSDHRLAGAPHNAPFRLRVVGRSDFGTAEQKTIGIDLLRDHIPADLAADVAALLAGGATFAGRPVTAGDVAVLVADSREAGLCQRALNAVGIPAVFTGDSDVLTSPAADAWVCLLEAFDQTHRSGLVRAAAASVFFGHSPAALAAGGDELTDTVAATLRDWAEHVRNGGPAAVFEAAKLAGIGARVLTRPDGERMMTDLTHISQVLHELVHRDRLGTPALLAWLHQQRERKGRNTERSRRLDSDAAAVQIMTVWRAKGLQFPIVYLPFAFNRNIKLDDNPRFHDEHDQRCRHIGGPHDPDCPRAKALSATEQAGDSLRVTYVALTRAQSQVVAWWAPSWDECTGGLSRLLRGRRAGEPGVPDRCAPRTISDADAHEIFAAWQAAGGPVVEAAVPVAPVQQPAPDVPTDLAVRRFHRVIDSAWRRTSYSALVRAVDATGGVRSEPEVPLRDDESDDATPGPAGRSSPVGADVVSPMAMLPGGKTFGTLVHAVLQNADPRAGDLTAELAAQARRHAPWWAVDVAPEALGAALVPMHDTALGSLAEGATLRDFGRPDRLCELDFEIPLAGGDRADPMVPEVSLFDVGELLRAWLPGDDIVAGYADRLTRPGLGDQSLRGYLTGSIDVVLRLPAGKYLVVDYKTNRLGDTAADYGLAAMAHAMEHSDYVLQALLYCVALHRFLRWRHPGYRPERQLGGVLYLFVRGMCGPDTPVLDGQPAGVFSWAPPPQLVVALSELLHQGRAAA